MHSHQKCMRIPSLHILASPYFPFFVLFCFFNNYGHLSGFEVVLHVVLICISPVIHDVGVFFMCLLTICLSSLENCLFRLLCVFLNWVIHFVRCHALHPLLVGMTGSVRWPGPWSLLAQTESSVSLHTCREMTTLIGPPDTYQHQLVPQLLLSAPCGPFPTQQ